MFRGLTLFAILITVAVLGPGVHTRGRRIRGRPIIPP